MLHQWDQRTGTDARQIGGVGTGSDRRLAKIRRRDPNRPPPSVRKRDNDVVGTAPRPLLQHLKPLPKKKMIRVGDRDVRHDPLKNRGTLSCSAIPPLAMRYWTASFTMRTASSSKATVYAVRPAKRKNHDCLTRDRPAGPQAPPMDRRGDLQANPPTLTRRLFPAQMQSSAVFASERSRSLESVITIAWNT